MIEDQKQQEVPVDEPEDEHVPDPTPVWLQFAVALGVFLALCAMFYCYSRSTFLYGRDEVLAREILAVRQANRDLSAAFVSTHVGKGPVEYFDGETTRSVSW